jgi:hypothetical protein
MAHIMYRALRLIRTPRVVRYSPSALELFRRGPTVRQLLC